MPGQAIDFPEIEQARLLIHNALASGCEQWRWSGDPKGFSCRPRVVTGSYTNPMLIEGKFGADDFSAQVERSSVAAILAHIDQDISMDGLAPETIALLIEHALDGIMANCEAKTGQKFSLLRISAPALSFEQDALGLEFTFGGLEPAFLSVRGPHGIYEALLSFARSLPTDFSRLSATRHQVSIRLAMAMLPAGEIQTLAAGDMVVIEPQDAPSVVLVCNEYALAAARIIGAKIHLSTSFQCSRYGNLGDFMMSSPSGYDMGTAQPIARLADMPVKIAFELGRLDVSLAELASAGEGHVFILPTPLTNGCALVVGGAVIGRGEVVKVGDQFAVRITSMAPQ